jgi:hypothetical protein
MDSPQLNFSLPSILGLAFVSILLGTASAGLGYELKDAELMRYGHILRLLGPDGMRIFLIVTGSFMTFSGLAALRRAVGNRVAAAIRYDGIELNGILVSRYIPWRSLDRLYLREWRYRGTTYQHIKAEARRPPGESVLRHFLGSLFNGISTQLIDATDTEVARWVETANAARPKSFTPRRPVAARRMAPTKIGFGRRSN